MITVYLFFTYAVLIIGYRNNVQLVQSFSCHKRTNGYYADINAGCEMYYMCHDSIKFHYKCPQKTLFNQRMLICDHWFMVNCNKSALSYHVNELIGQKHRKFMEENEIFSRTPRSDIDSITNVIYKDIFDRKKVLEPREIIETSGTQWRSPPLKKTKFSKKLARVDAEVKLSTNQLAKISSYFKSPNVHFNYSHNSETNSSWKFKPVIANKKIRPQFDYRKLQKLYEIPIKFHYRLQDTAGSDLKATLSRNLSSYDVCLFLDQAICHKSNILV